MKLVWGRLAVAFVQLMIICGWFVILAHADDGLPELVGAFADPAHLTFKGDSPFTDAQLHEAVQGDLQLQIASCPSAKLADYLSVLDSRLRDGFNRAGYHHPIIKVNADPATSNIVVNLDLGQRWKCGKVVIKGASTVPVDELTKRLTKSIAKPFFENTVSDDEISVSEQPCSDDSDEAQWVPGDPAPFDNYRPDELTAFVRRQLATMGYFHPFLRTSVEPADKDADLIINLIDEGPRAILDHIEFQTLHRNSPANVISLLNIKSGDPVDLNRIYDMQRRLWDSGRFIRHKILVKRIPGDDVRIVLEIQIKEAENVPLLNEPLSDIDKALLRFRDWWMVAGDKDEDVVAKISMRDYDLQWVWGGSRGTAAIIKVKDQPTVDILGDDRELGFLATKSMVGVYLPLAKLRLEEICDPSKIRINFTAASNSDSSARNNWLLGFGFTGNSEAQSGKARREGLKVDRWIAPCAVLSYFREDGKSLELRGSTLIAACRGFTMRIDSASGELLDAVYDDPAANEHVSFAVQQGALDAIQKSLLESPGNNIQLADQSATASVSKFMTQMLLHTNMIAPSATTQQRHKLAEIVGRVIDVREFDQLGGLVTEIFPARFSDTFYLPIDENFSRPQGIIAMGAMMGLTTSDRLFAARSWPWTVGRCVCFALCNLADSVNPELQRLCESPDTGPLANLVVAELIQTRSPEHSRIFARNGLVKLSPELFAKDCQALFNGNPQMTAMALQITENLRSLSDDDIEAVATQLPPNPASAFRATVQELKSHPGAITADEIAAALGKAWDSGLNATVEAELNRLTARQ